MFARVLRLRKNGALLRQDKVKAAWDHGIFELRSKPRRLTLRLSISPPGLGEIMAMHAPVLYAITPHPAEFFFRGFEVVSEVEAEAVVCQEWAVVFGSERDHEVTLRDYRGANSTKR